MAEKRETLKNAELDLALVDLAMPGMDGYEVALRVRQNPRLNDLCLVAITGFSQREARERSKAAGFGHDLVKPITASALRTSSPAAARIARIDTTLSPLSRTGCR